jgi:hypothetical protein
MGAKFVPSTFGDLDGKVDAAQLPESGVVAGQYGIATYTIDQHGRVTDVSPAPSLGGDLSYVHTQTVPAASWTINHNLGKYPAVTVADSSGSVVEGDVVYLSLNFLRIDFSASFGGVAYLN